MKRIAFSTLGCRLNRYETDSLVSRFRAAGYMIVGRKEKADAVRDKHLYRDGAER